MTDSQRHQREKKTGARNPASDASHTTDRCLICECESYTHTQETERQRMRLSIGRHCVLPSLCVSVADWREILLGKNSRRILVVIKSKSRRQPDYAPLSPFIHIFSPLTTQHTQGVNYREHVILSQQDNGRRGEQWLQTSGQVVTGFRPPVFGASNVFSLTP